MRRPLTRVCYVIPSLDVGGTERQLLSLMQGLVRDHELTVICTRHEGTMAGEARRLGAYVRLAASWGGWDFTLERRIRHMFRAHRPDVVHSFLFGFDLPVNRAARITNVPVVVSSRRQRATWKKGRHVRVQKKANKLVDAIVANSRAVAEYARNQEGLASDAIQVIYNGIDADAYVSGADPHIIRERYGIPHDRHIAGMVANFSPVKDHPLFIRAAELILKKRQDVHFVLVGSGPNRKEITRKLRNGKWKDHFTRVSTIQEIADIYKIMDVSVLTSRTEGFPNAVIEAMAAYRPVVAPAVGGIVEQIEDGVTGHLIADRQPELFAAALEHLLDHPDEARAMGEHAGAVVRERFTIDAMVSGYKTLYRDLLAKSTRRSA